MKNLFVCKTIVVLLLFFISFCYTTAQNTYTRQNDRRNAMRDTQRASTMRSQNASQIDSKVNRQQSSRHENDNQSENNTFGSYFKKKNKTEINAAPKKSSSFNNSDNSQTENSITLVVSGEGINKEEATKNALRSAIEQAFGTFVSSNAIVINDELIRDEIATVSSGNIQNYKELSTIDIDGGKNVTLQATVSIGKLVAYAQNKGMQTELAGATFAMNKKMRKLNKENEYSAMQNLCVKLSAISESGLFDYKLDIEEPRTFGISDGAELSGYNIVSIKVTPTFNKNGELFMKTFWDIIKALSLSETEIAEYKKANEKIYMIQKGFRDSETYYLRNNYGCRLYGGDEAVYQTLLLPPVNALLNKSLYSFKIEDNIGNDYSFSIVRENNVQWSNYGDYAYKRNGYIESDRCAKDFEYYDRKTKQVFYYFDEKNNIITNWIVSQENTGPYLGSKAYGEWLKSQTFIVQSLKSINVVDHHDVRQYIIINEPEIANKNIEFKAIYSDEDIEKLQNINIIPIKL